jgi:hypothetical protein
MATPTKKARKPRKPASKRMPKDRFTLGAGYPKLTILEYKWAEAYLKTFNKVDAARIAKLSRPDVDGCAMFKRPHVKQYLAVRIQEIIPKSKDELLVRFTHQGNSPWLDLLDIDEKTGRLKDFNFKRARDSGSLGLLRKVQCNAHTGSIGVELVDPQTALKTIAQLLGYLKNEEGTPVPTKNVWEDD